MLTKKEKMTEIKKGIKERNRKNLCGSENYRYYCKDKTFGATKVRSMAKYYEADFPRLASTI